MNLLSTIERFIAASGMSPSRFGRSAIGDPRLLSDLRRGRECRPRMVERVLAFIAEQTGTDDARA